MHLPDFSKHTRVTLKGSYDDLSAFGAADPADIAECTIPASGHTYRALRMSDGERASIAFNMVSECAERVAEGRSIDSLEQILKYTRLVHMVYEHGAEL